MQVKMDILYYITRETNSSGGVRIMELWDDPMWDCDYHSRCDNRILKKVLDDLTIKYDTIRSGH